MQTLEHSLSELIDEGLIDWEDAAAVSLYPKEIRHPEVSDQHATHRPASG
jgi:hypothetical protein